MTLSKKGLNASALKYIAIAAMFIDHSAHLFVPSDTVLYFVMRFIGRSTLPIMVFFISEGYHHTRNIRRYYLRMMTFAVISHFAYSFCFLGVLFSVTKSSVITTLTLCLLSVDILNNPKVRKAYKLPLILLVSYFAGHCDWGINAIAFTLAFELSRGNKKEQCIAYSIAALWYCMPALASVFHGDLSVFVRNLMKLGVFVPGVLLLTYNGEKGGGKYTKWVFYIFYPLHLLLLGAVNYYIV